MCLILLKKLFTLISDKICVNVVSLAEAYGQITLAFNISSIPQKEQNNRLDNYFRTLLYRNKCIATTMARYKSLIFVDDIQWRVSSTFFLETSKNRSLKMCLVTTTQNNLYAAVVIDLHRKITIARTSVNTCKNAGGCRIRASLLKIPLLTE